MITNIFFEKAKEGWKLIKSLEKLNLCMYMDDMKFFGENEEELEIFIQTIKIFQ